MENRRFLKIIFHQLTTGLWSSVHEIAVGAQLAVEIVKTGLIRVCDRMPIAVQADGSPMIDIH